MLTSPRPSQRGACRRGATQTRAAAAVVTKRGWASPSKGMKLVETPVVYEGELAGGEVEVSVTVRITLDRISLQQDSPASLLPAQRALPHGPPQCVPSAWPGMCAPAALTPPTPVRDDDWGASSFPLFPGHEVVGTITDVGAGVGDDRIGERVGVGWICGSCRRCTACLAGEENICQQGYRGLIVGPDAKGGFAQRVRVPADFCYPIPDALSSEAVAPLLCAGITVYQPIRKWVKPASRVAIVGVGGLGHLALQFADAVGGVVTAIDMDASKEAEARGFGARRFVHLPEFQSEPKASARRRLRDAPLTPPPPPEVRGHL